MDKKLIMKCDKYRSDLLLIVLGIMREIRVYTALTD